MYGGLNYYIVNNFQLHCVQHSHCAYVLFKVHAVLARMCEYSCTY